LLVKYLPLSINDLKNLEFRDKVMQASLLAGLAFSNASLGLVHAMAHSLGGYSDMAHGECNAILLAHVVNFNYSDAKEKYDNIAKLFDLDLATIPEATAKLIFKEKLILFAKSIGIIEGVGKGIKMNDLAILAEKALNDPCYATNPKAATVNDVITIFKAAF